MNRSNHSAAIQRGSPNGALQRPGGDAHKEAPGRGNGTGAGSVTKKQHNYGNKFLTDWRDYLPSADDYYRANVESLGRPNASGFAQGKCPFHEDCNASLSVNVRGAKGFWKCFAGCGGGDLVDFHMRLTGLSFKQAVLDLMGVAS